jgi:uracil-DNA glycosylase
LSARTFELSTAQRHAFRREAELIDGIDIAAYAEHGRDWRDPIIGLGPPNAPLCIFGRDPGRTEVEHGVAFVGRGGQLVRAGLHRRRFGANAEAPSFDESVAAGAEVFWLNTVPYKPVGNKAWSMAVKRRFQPLMADLLMNAWRGRLVIVLGREAFFWFGMGQAPEVAKALDAFWQRDDRYSTTLPIGYRHGEASRELVLAPLPHPSPANAVWFARFPALLAARLQATDL